MKAVKESDFIREHLQDEKLSERLKFLKLVRQFEREGHPNALRDDVVYCIATYSL